MLLRIALNKKKLFWAIKHWLANDLGGKEEIIQYINNILLFIPFEFLMVGFLEIRWKTDFDDSSFLFSVY